MMEEMAYYPLQAVLTAHRRFRRTTTTLVVNQDINYNKYFNKNYGMNGNLDTRNFLNNKKLHKQANLINHNDYIIKNFAPNTGLKVYRFVGDPKDELSYYDYASLGKKLTNPTPKNIVRHNAVSVFSPFYQAWYMFLTIIKKKNLTYYDELLVSLKDDRMTGIIELKIPDGEVLIDKISPSGHNNLLLPMGLDLRDYIVPDSYVEVLRSDGILLPNGEVVFPNKELDDYIN